MKNLLVLTGLTVGLALGLGSNSYSAVSDWQKGIAVQPATSQDFSSETFKLSVTKAALSGVNSVSLVIPLRQDNIHSSTVFAALNTPTDESLLAGVRFLKSKGMHVSFAMHVNPNDYKWRAFINPDQRLAWFDSYTAVLKHYAVLAQANGVQEIVLGTELSSTTDPSIDSTNTPNWINLIQQIRAVYGGSLTYSAQHAGSMADGQKLGFWPYLDKIGISAYYGLGTNDNASPSELARQWDVHNNAEVRVLAERYNKPVIFTEIGYVSHDGALKDPGSAYSLDTPANQAVQAKAYEALFSYWNQYPYMTGVTLWDWSSNPDAGGSSDRGYTPQGKTAELVMKDWFTRANTGNPGAPGTAAPPFAGTLSIWWPSGNQPVSGTQPFMAVVDGVDLSRYKMYWQVDGGQLNEMQDSYAEYPHKQSWVDLSGWHWNPNHQYSISFVARDANGLEIVRKVSITLY